MKNWSILPALIAASLLCACCAGISETTYKGLSPVGENGRNGLQNPERGFRYEALVGELEEADTAKIDRFFETYRSDGVSVTQAYCYLTPYYDCDIPQEKLDALQASFDKARRLGVKYLLRFAYEADDVKEGPTCERILSHIRQLTPIVRDNIDVIYVLQTGWVGLWGEFHGSIHGIEKDPVSVARIVEATLEMLPEGHFTMMRRIAYKETALRILGDEREISAETAFSDAPHARIGFFNDGTLANFNDGGTFPEEYPYSEHGNREFDRVCREGAFMPVDGELYWTSPGVTNPLYANGLRAIERFRDHHYTTFSMRHAFSELDRQMKWTIDYWKETPVDAAFLDAFGFDYDPDYFEGVQCRSTFEFIRDHLGYRIKLKSSRTEADSLVLTLHNYGFAPPMKPRTAVLVKIGRDGSCAEFETGLDCRTLASALDVEWKVCVPPLKRGEKLALWLPDGSETLRYRPEYSIRLANDMQVKIIDGRLLHILR